MSTPTVILDPNGEAAQVLEISQDNTKAHVRLRDGRTLWIDRNAIRQEGGSLRFPAPFSTALSPESHGIAEPQDLVVPVYEERARVEKQTVDTAKVQIHKRVVERQEVIDQQVWREDVAIERVPMNQEVQGPLSIRYEGDVMVVPLVEEVIVVQKKLMLREEVRISRRRETVSNAQPVTLRREEIEVDRTDVHPGTNPEVPQQGQRVAHEGVNPA